MLGLAILRFTFDIYVQDLNTNKELKQGTYGDEIRIHRMKKVNK